jgi:tetratricopeptide (TPR) repeat protein
VLAALVLLVVAVVWLLPGYVDPVPEPVGDDAAVVQPKAKPPSETQTRSARLKREAERALQEYLQRQAVLEAQNVTIWGGTEYENALQTLATADAAFANADFGYAKSGYEAAGAILDDLESSRSRRLNEALARGGIALDQYDAITAGDQFEIALAIDPGSSAAQTGAARAEKVEQLAKLLSRASESIDNGDWTVARQWYQEAVALAPWAADAQRGLQIVVAELGAMRFRELMSGALAAIESGKFAAARESLSAADALVPGSSEVADVRRRMNLAVQRRQITGHRSKADKLVQAERWHEAVREFDAVLAIDPQAQFAVQGAAESRRLAQLNDQIDNYVHKPERLQSLQPRNNARTLLESSDSIENKGPRLQQKYQQLAALVELAETPVPVGFVSDGMTDVTINRVGSFGKFRGTTITLLPGRYIVRGERLGYRDVRLELVVMVGSATPDLVVQCEEKI